MALKRLNAAAATAVDDYYERCRAAEEHWEEEAHAALVLQSCWRGRLQRQELRKLGHVAVTIQRCWRGYLGRQRFAAALSAHNTQLREAYFHHQATIIQKCWRGCFSRSRVHDFYKRKAYLSAVAAANAAVRAGMAAELQEALAHQQQQAQQATKQHFDAQVSRLHHLASTGCRPGIFSATAAAARAVGEPPAVAGQPLEQHLRAAAKQQAAEVVKQQQGHIRQTMRSSNTSPAAAFNFPGGTAAARAARASAAVQECSSSGVAAPHSSPAHLRPLSGASLPASTLYAHSSGSATGPLKGVAAAGKLASAVVASVDDWYALRADANMPDGSFNPSLSLQQSADYEAARQASNLEGRISRGLMLVLHNGQPFNNITKPPSVIQPSSPGGNSWSSSDAGQTLLTAQHQAATWNNSEQLSTGRCSGSQHQQTARAPGSPQHRQQLQQQLWQHNKHAGSFFAKHLKESF